MTSNHFWVFPSSSSPLHLSMTCISYFPVYFFVLLFFFSFKRLSVVRSSFLFFSSLYFSSGYLSPNFSSFLSIALPCFALLCFAFLPFCFSFSIFLFSWLSISFVPFSPLLRGTSSILALVARHSEWLKALLSSFSLCRSREEKTKNQHFQWNSYKNHNDKSVSLGF